MMSRSDRSRGVVLALLFVWSLSDQRPAPLGRAALQVECIHTDTSSSYCHAENSCAIGRLDFRQRDRRLSQNAVAFSGRWDRIRRVSKLSHRLTGRWGQRRTIVT